MQRKQHPSVDGGHIICKFFFKILPSYEKRDTGIISRSRFRIFICHPDKKRGADLAPLISKYPLIFRKYI